METREKRIVLWSVSAFVLVLFALCIVAFVFNKPKTLSIKAYDPVSGSYQTYSLPAEKDIEIELSLKEGYEFGGLYSDESFSAKIENSQIEAGKTYVALYLKIIKNKDDLLKINKNDKFLTIKYDKNAFFDLSEASELLKNVEVLDLSGVSVNSDNIIDSAFENSKLKRLVLPSNTKVISAQAFKNCYNLCSVSGMEGVEIIGAKAFYNCFKLSNLELGNVKSVGDEAFAFSKIQNFDFGAGLKELSSTSLQNCNVTSVSFHENPNFIFEDGVIYTSDHIKALFGVKNRDKFVINAQTRAIEPYAFAGSLVKDVEILGQLSSVGEYAFANCQNLKTISAPLASELKIESHAFYGTQVLSSIGQVAGIERIEESAFEGSGVRQISFENDLKTLGKHSFKNCKNLSQIDISSADDMGEGVFEGCTALEKSKVNVSTYSQNMFYGCISLSKVEGQDAERIENYAFCGCQNLESIDPLLAASKVGVGAFKNCSSLSGVNFDNLIIVEYEAFAGCTNLSYANFEVATTINERAFYGCEKLKTFVLKSHVESFDESAFDESGLERIDSLSENFIGQDGVLYNKQKNAIICYPICKNATTFTIEANILEIQSLSFYKNKYLQEINVQPENPSFESFMGVLYNRGRTSLVKYPNNKQYSSAIVYTTVTRIEKYAFLNNQRLTELRILDNVLEIENGALYNMEKLAKLSIGFLGKNQDEENFIGYAFGAKNYQENSDFLPKTLKEVELSEQSRLAPYAFYGCKWLEKININDKVKVVGEYAFAGLANLREINFAGKIERIKDYSIYNLASLNVLSFMFNEDLALEENSLGMLSGNLSVRVLKDNSKSSMQQRSLLKNKFTQVYNLSSSWKWYFDYE